LQQIGESQPVSAIRLGFFGKKFKALVLLEQKELIAQRKSSLLGRLWSLTDAGRNFLNGSSR
jgi:ABC-type polysaccharide/polyol phosphate export permease